MVVDVGNMPPSAAWTWTATLLLVPNLARRIELQQISRREAPIESIESSEGRAWSGGSGWCKSVTDMTAAQPQPQTHLPHSLTEF
jgi:hypothetical protein